MIVHKLTVRDGPILVLVSEKVVDVPIPQLSRIGISAKVISAYRKKCVFGPSLLTVLKKKDLLLLDIWGKMRLCPEDLQCKMEQS